MIGRIRGTLVSKQLPEILVDVAGVGYEVQVPITSLAFLPDLGNEVSLHTHFVVREDAQLLFGFHDSRSRELFRALIKVNGVGPKLGLGILSGMDVDEFVRCVADDNVAALVKLPGVGKKTAERLLIEMRDRLKGWESAAPSALSRGQDHIAEAEAALLALGYKAAEAEKAIKAVAGPEHGSAETLVRAALQGMLKK